MLIKREIPSFPPRYVGELHQKNSMPVA